MQKDFSDCTRTFVHTGAAWYAESALSDRTYADQLTVSMAAKLGGTRGEFSVAWYDVGGDSSPRLEVFGDAWAALAAMPDLLAALAQLDHARTPFMRPQRVTPAQFIELLKGLGFEDRTPYAPT